MARATSALRQILDDGVSLSGLFNAVRGGAGNAASDKLGSGQSSADKANVGQVSAVGLRPISLEEKLQALKMMIAKGKFALASNLSMETIKHELKKPEHNGIGINEMVSILTQKKLLKPVQKLVKAYKLGTLAPRLM